MVKIFSYFIVAFILVIAIDPAFASSTGMPWETPLENLLNSITGPVSRIIGAISIIGLGLGVAFSEGGSFLRKALYVVLGLAIAFNATSWGLNFVGFAGGAVI